MADQKTYTGSREHALAALRANQGNAKKTARELGMPRSTLLHWRMQQNLVSKAVATTIAERRPDVIDRAIEIAAQYMALQEIGLEQALRVLPMSEELRDVLSAIREGREGHLDYTQGRRGMQVNVDARQQQVLLIDL